jgi:pentatricopeptide repeat protein
MARELRCGALAKAAMPQGVPPVTRTYNTLMIACNTSGQWQQALEVHKEMRAAGHMLNTTSYNALISAHSKSGHLDQVLTTYRSMVEEVGASPFTKCPHPAEKGLVCFLGSVHA